MSNPQNISDAVFALIPATYESLRAASGEDLSALGMVSVSRDGFVLAHTATVGISLNDQQLMMANADSSRSISGPHHHGYSAI